MEQALSPKPLVPATKATSDTPANPLASSKVVVRGASLLIIFQILSRAITFSANQLLLRFITAQLLGVATQLEVYYMTVLFFARESLRIAIQRSDEGGSSNTVTSTGSRVSRVSSSISAQSAVNVSYLGLAAGIPLAAVFGVAYFRSLDETLVNGTPYLVTALATYGLAALAELAAEPAYAVLTLRLRLVQKGHAESLATLARCIVSLTTTAAWGSVVGASDASLGVLPFALGQAAYSGVLCAVYISGGLQLAHDEGFSLLPRQLTAAATATSYSSISSAARGHLKDVDQEGQVGFAWGYFSCTTLRLARSMLVQCLVKYFLTQGDTLLVSMLGTPDAVGIYALVSNYGGLLARLVFQPVEESSRAYFSRLSAAPSLDTDENRHNDDLAMPSKAMRERQARLSLTTLIRMYLILGLTLTALAPGLVPHALPLLLGPRWKASAAAVEESLALYVALYIPLMALNGIAEAFVSSVVGPRHVHYQSIAMAVFTAACGVIGFVALRVLQMGARGIVIANVANMACRIAWCAWFIQEVWWRGTTTASSAAQQKMVWADALPTGSATTTAVAAAVVMWTTGSGNTVEVASPKTSESIIALLKAASIAAPFGLYM